MKITKRSQFVEQYQRPDAVLGPVLGGGGAPALGRGGGRNPRGRGLERQRGWGDDAGDVLPQSDVAARDGLAAVELARVAGGGVAAGARPVPGFLGVNAPALRANPADYDSLFALLDEGVVAKPPRRRRRQRRGPASSRSPSGDDEGDDDDDDDDGGDDGGDGATHEDGGSDAGSSPSRRSGALDGSAATTATGRARRWTTTTTPAAVAGARAAASDPRPRQRRPRSPPPRSARSGTCCKSWRRRRRTSRARCAARSTWARRGARSGPSTAPSSWSRWCARARTCRGPRWSSSTRCSSNPVALDPAFLDSSAGALSALCGQLARDGARAAPSDDWVVATVEALEEAVLRLGAAFDPLRENVGRVRWRAGPARHVCSAPSAGPTTGASRATRRRRRRAPPSPRPCCAASAPRSPARVVRGGARAGRAGGLHRGVAVDGPRRVRGRAAVPGHGVLDAVPGAVLVGAGPLRAVRGVAAGRREAARGARARRARVWPARTG